MSTRLFSRFTRLVSLAGRDWYTASSIVLTLCFVALGCMWVNLVPAFESPDEPAHFDYAYSLASAGHLLRAADGYAAFDPRVAIMMRDAGLNRIAFSAGERVERSYGSPRYYAKIRRDTANYAGYTPDAANAPRSPLMNVYPFVPYALYAVAAFPFRTDVGRSLVACRFASVAFTAIGLFAWSRTMRRLRVSRAHALALLAIVVFFPLTAFVGSYVQPDTVAFLLVSILLLVALRIRDGGANVAHGVVYAILLTILYGTKLQFAVAVGLATIVPVVIAYARKFGVATSVGLASACALALAGMFALMQWIMQGSKSPSYFQGRQTLTSAFFEHAATGEARFVLDESRFLIGDLLGGGTSQRSFWGLFGWLDAPIRIVNYTTTDAFATFETIGTAIVLVAVVATLALRLRRLVRVASHRAVSVAIRIAARDPAMNAYLFFAAIFVTLFVISDNVFGAQGRDWYPFEVVAFLSASWYGVRAFPRRLQPFFSVLALASLAVVSTVGSAFALTTLEDRFYQPIEPTRHPNLQRLQMEAIAAAITLDSVDLSGKSRPASELAGAVLSNRSRIVLHGWAYDPTTSSPCRAMYVAIDERFDHWMLYGFDRSDVGRVFDRYDLALSGFIDTIDFHRFRPGNHSLALVCVASDGASQFVQTQIGDIVILR